MPPDTPSGHPQSETSRAAVASFHRRGERAGCRRSACHQSMSAPGESYVRCGLPPSAEPAPRRLERLVVQVSQSSRISFLWTIVMSEITSCIEFRAPSTRDLPCTRSIQGHQLLPSQLPRLRPESLAQVRRWQAGHPFVREEPAGLRPSPGLPYNFAGKLVTLCWREYPVSPSELPEPQPAQVECDVAEVFP